MFCPQCGKEISDDSKFCYKCGSKIDLVKPTDNIENISIPSIKTESTTKIQSIKEEPHITDNENDIKPSIDKESYTEQQDIKQESQIIIDNPTDLSPPIKTKYPGYGWVLLLLIYGSYIVQPSILNFKRATVTSMFIQLIWFTLLFVIYFKYRERLIKRKPQWNIKKISSLSGVVSLFVVGSFLNISLGFHDGYLRKQEMNEFVKTFQPQLEKIMKQELEISKILEVNPKSKKDVEDRIITLDGYKILIREKRNLYINLINFFNDMKSNSKNEKILSDKIKTFQSLTNYMMTSSDKGVYLLKSYYLTGEEKYYDEEHKIYLEHQTLKTEVTKQINDIVKLF